MVARSRSARVADVHELAAAMPHVKVVHGRSGNPVYQVGGKSFVFFRTPRPDATDPVTGERYPDVIVFWVPSEADKHALVQDEATPFFTTPHFDGHPSVLVRASRLGELSLLELTEVVQDAWLSRASPTRAAAWLATQRPTGGGMGADAVAVEDDGPVLRAVLPLPGCSAARALSAFTDPELLPRWWGGGELSTSLSVGGPYVVAFAALGRTMTGHVLSYQPGRALEFSWAWDGVDGPGNTVRVQVDDGEPATLTVEHGMYDDSQPGRVARAEHRAGWEHFLPQLAATLSEQRG